jgi:hypothetical protein
MNLLDKLPKISLPFGKNQESAEYFFGLNISLHTVTACVWGIENNRLKIINTAESPYEGEGDLVEASNFVLDQALGEFQPEPTKILFGVPDDWLQDDDLKAEHLKTLKHLVKELDVIPMAYVATSHSITHLLQKQTGAPVTAVLVSIANPLVISVVKGGKILGTKTLKRGENLPKDIEKALLTFTDVEVLPSRILIYGSENMNKYKEELLSFSWMAQLPFLHLPKIEELDKQVVIQAISFAGASEINPHISLHRNDLEIQKPKPGAVKQFHNEEPHKGKRGAAPDGFVAGDIEDVANVVPAEQIEMEDEEMAGEERVRDVDVFGNEHPARRPSHHPVHHEKALIPSGLALPGALASLGRFGSTAKLLIIPAIILIEIVVFLFLQKATVTVFFYLRTL